MPNCRSKESLPWHHPRQIGEFSSILISAKHSFSKIGYLFTTYLWLSVSLLLNGLDSEPAKIQVKIVLNIKLRSPQTERYHRVSLGDRAGQLLGYISCYKIFCMSMPNVIWNVCYHNAWNWGHRGNSCLHKLNLILLYWYNNNLLKKDSFTVCIGMQKGKNKSSKLKSRVWVWDLQLSYVTWQFCLQGVLVVRKLFSYILGHMCGCIVVHFFVLILSSFFNHLHVAVL